MGIYLYKAWAIRQGEIQRRKVVDNGKILDGVSDMKEGHEESSPTPHRRKASVTAYEELYGKFLSPLEETAQEVVPFEEPIERTVHEKYPAVCVSCGQNTKVPFKP